MAETGLLQDMELVKNGLTGQALGSSEDCMSYLRLTVCGIQTFGRLKLTMGALSAVEEESANAV